MIITLEGSDGCGKSTAANLLADTLCAAGWDAGVLREPGGTRLGESLRTMLLDPEYAIDKATQPLLFTASRVQLLTDVGPALDRGKILIFDRFWHSTVAYQCYGNDSTVETVRALNKISSQALWPTDAHRESHNRAVVSFHLQVSTAERARRLVETGKVPDRYEGEKSSFKERVAQAYEDLENGAHASLYGIDRLIPISAETQPIDVVNEVITRVSYKLPPRG